MKNLNKYYLKLTALSPVHIGTGESFEPTNFVIDDGKLFEFDEVLFYKGLGELDKKSFNSKLNDWMQIIDFYKTHIETAKGISDFSTKVTKKVESKYKALKNKDGSKNKNQFEIHKIFKNPNTHRAIIPGSSIKGMLGTILKIYPPKSSNEIRQKLVLSDALLFEGETEIGYCFRKHKDPSKSAKSEIPQMVEIIKQNSTFLLSISTENSFEDIQSMMKKYHTDRKDSKYQEDKNSFIARIGKFSGKEYMVDDGKNVKNKYDKPIATHTLYEGDEPFGWIKIEKIDFDTFKQGLKNTQKQEEDYYLEKEQRHKKIRDKIQKVEQEAKLKTLQKEKEQEEKKREFKENQGKREAQLAAMSPLDRKIDELKENNQNPNETIDIIIYKALQDGTLDEFRCDALKLLQTQMKELGKWNEKNQKKKTFKRTQEVINMLKDCS